MSQYSESKMSNCFKNTQYRTISSWTCFLCVYVPVVSEVPSNFKKKSKINLSKFSKSTKNSNLSINNNPNEQVKSIKDQKSVYKISLKTPSQFKILTQPQLKDHPAFVDKKSYSGKTNKTSLSSQLSKKMNHSEPIIAYHYRYPSSKQIPNKSEGRDLTARLQFQQKHNIKTFINISEQNVRKAVQSELEENIGLSLIEQQKKLTYNSQRKILYYKNNNLWQSKIENQKESLLNTKRINLNIHQKKFDLLENQILEQSWQNIKHLSQLTEQKSPYRRKLTELKDQKINRKKLAGLKDQKAQRSGIPKFSCKLIQNSWRQEGDSDSIKQSILSHIGKKIKIGVRRALSIDSKQSQDHYSWIQSQRENSLIRNQQSLISIVQSAARLGNFNTFNNSIKKKIHEDLYN